ncbi:hypothetical protein [Mesorhizobium sp. CA16]|uniref:hypothetical protein n=1 Tax=Mesorhizobium sp. CA16 TaxID=588496 RepID=UPI001CCDDD33|nr:hypothetical protein [Mesorhizobium sp. CA16]MBZ9912560.1 hypothetical protein [Mesorhizobium sp. CA16]
MALYAPDIPADLFIGTSAQVSGRPLPTAWRLDRSAGYHLVRLAGIDADHDLVIGLGGLAGEDVENGPAVRMVHTKPWRFAIFRVLSFSPAADRFRFAE